MLWSSVSIAGNPTILVVDASHNLRGWEFEACDHVFSSMKRRRLLLKGSEPVQVECPDDLVPHLEPLDEYNCILLFSHGEGELVASDSNLRGYWELLNSYCTTSPKLFAACSWDSYDSEVSQEILDSPQSFAPLALAPQSPLTPREGFLFSLKFFTELNLHSEESITGKMVWFSCSKARELLRRRYLSGKVGLRC